MDNDRGKRVGAKMLMPWSHWKNQEDSGRRDVNLEKIRQRLLDINRAGSRAPPMAALGVTGRHPGTFTGGEDPAPKFMQMREKIWADWAQKNSM